MIETDDEKEFVSKTFTDSLNKNFIRTSTHFISLASVFAEMFNRTIKDFLKQPVFQYGDGNWVDKLPTITKQCNNRLHFSTKLMPIQASLKQKEG